MRAFRQTSERAQKNKFEASKGSRKVFGLRKMQGRNVQALESQMKIKKKYKPPLPSAIR